MKRTLALALILIFSGESFVSAENADKPKLDFSGFISTHIFYDSRQTVNGREALLLLYPAKPQYDLDGNDINASPLFNQLAMTSRLTATIDGFEILKAKSKGVMEADFSGQTNGLSNGFRLRHAYMRLDWEFSSLLIGQYWHPINIPEAIPSIEALSTGAPFRPFSRAPQVRWECAIGNTFKLVAVAAAQRDYASFGPNGQTSEYMRNAAIPNFHAQLQFKKGIAFAAIGGDVKTLKPTQVTSQGFKASETITSYAATAFLRFQPKKLDIKAQAVWGQNMAEHIMLGGYVEYKRDPITREYAYANTSQFSVWLDVKTTFDRWNFGVFAGYAQNLGYAENNINQFYGRANDIDNLFRIAPKISFTQKNFTIALEPDYTDAAYGTVMETGKVLNPERVANTRLLLTVTYKF